MALVRFTENTELANLIKFYTASYEQAHPELKAWSRYDDFQIIKTADGAAVYLDPETAMPHTKNERIAFCSIGKNIAMQILKCATYFLAQNIPLDDVPDELRIGLAINHENSHWTGVAASITSFKQFYKTMQEHCTLAFFAENGTDPTSLRKLYGNAIYEKLGIIIETNADKTKIATPELERAQAILRCFPKNIRLSHFDSLNSGYYADRVDQCLELFSPKKNAENNQESLFATPIQHIRCSHQQGNTCGDHTIANLFSFGTTKKIPIINDDKQAEQPDKPKITSESLRQLTDRIKPEETNDNLTEMTSTSTVTTDFLTQQKNQLILKNHISSIEKNYVNPRKIKFGASGIGAFELDTIELVDDLFLLAGVATSALINEARSEKGIREEFLDTLALQEESKEKIKTISYQLQDIFNGFKNSTTEKIFEHTAKENLLVYGKLAGLIASDRSAECELNKYSTDKDPRDLEAQIKKYHEFHQEHLKRKSNSTFISKTSSFSTSSSSPSTSSTASSSTPSSSSSSKSSPNPPAPEVKEEPVSENKIFSPQYAAAKTRLEEACFQYLNHIEKEFKDINLNVEDLEKNLKYICDLTAENFNAYSAPKENPISTQHFLNFTNLQSLLRKKNEITAYAHNREFQQVYKKFMDNTNVHLYEGLIKKAAVTEIYQALKSGKDAKSSIEDCEKQLHLARTMSILMINRQSQGEKFLKILSVIGILAGVGLFTTAGLIIKRLYDTKGHSVNFFKPLTTNLYQDIDKQIRQLKNA